MTAGSVVTSTEELRTRSRESDEDFFLHLFVDMQHTTRDRPSQMCLHMLEILCGVWATGRNILARCFAEL